MQTKTNAMLTAFMVVALPLCWLRAQDLAPASSATAPKKGTEAASAAKASGEKTGNSAAQKPLKRVTGIGGVFIKAKDPVKLRAWYKTHLGIDVQTWGGTSFKWVDAAGVPTKGKTAWFVGDGSNFAPSDASFMINYRVADLRGLLKLLREEGCQVLDKVEQSDFGIFGWAMDPEGNKVELWQPPEGQ
jgi:predicted enzyme related to lactoylglutathione lyase